MDKPTIIEWAPNTGALCVVSQHEDIGNVAFYDHLGKRKDEGPSRPSEVNCVKWHPTEKFVTAGYKDGCCCFISQLENVFHYVSEKDIYPVTAIDWSHDGKLLMTLFETSFVRLYSYMKFKGNIDTTIVFQIELPGEILTTCKRLLYEKIKPINSNEIEDLNDDMPIKRKGNERKEGQLMGTEFLLGCKTGTIYGIDKSHHRVVHKLDSDIKFLDYCEQISMIIAFTNDSFIFHLAQGSVEGKCLEKIKVKLGGEAESYKMELNEGMLIMCYAEKDMRIWDLEKEENGTIALDINKGFDKDDKISIATVNAKKGMIAAVTTQGYLAEWNKNRKKEEKTIDVAWKLKPATNLESQASQMKWSPILNSLAVVLDEGLLVLEDQSNIIQMKGKIAAIQTNKNCFTLLNCITGVAQDLKLTIPSAKGICLGEKQLVVWNDETVVTYDVQSSLATLESTSFACSTTCVIISQQSLYCVEKDKIMVRTLQGTPRQVLSLPEIEGDPMILDLNKDFMAVGTSHGFIRIYDLSKKDSAHPTNSKWLMENVPKFLKFKTVKINPVGNKVACSFYEDESTISDLLLAYDSENDSISYFSFDRGMTDTQEYEAQAELAQTSNGRPVTAAARKMAKEKSRFQMMCHRAGEMEWDSHDPRYLVIECNHIQPDSADQNILTMFVTSEHGIQLQDVQQKSAHCGKLVSVSVPNFFFYRRAGWDEETARGERIIGKLLIAKVLREFSGVENCDDKTRIAMMDFSFFLTIGSMDAAFKAIQFIKSESVWEHMASMSVKTRRLDVAMVCLGHMKNVRGARCVRKSRMNGENESMQCAALAIELGMLDEAHLIYAQNDRWDLVNRLYQNQNLWDMAFEVAKSKDRIHLRNTHYNYAKFIEKQRDNGSIEKAIMHYEMAGVHSFEVFRMLKNYPKSMEQYVRKKREPALFKWWGAYLESHGELDGAASFYTFANDFYALVRVKTQQGKMEEASKIANESKDRASCYHIGRIYEANGDVVQAVKFFTKARALSSAIRLARDNDMKDKLANLCLMAGGAELVSAARYYEDMPGYAHKAVMLYHKAGMIGRALDLAFRTEQFSALDLITKDLDDTTDPKILKRASEFFENNQNYEKAVNFLCLAKDFSAAVRLCRSRNVRVTDKFAELMTPTKEDMPNDTERKRVLEGVGELCLQQGAYSAAAKKYTQAGDKLTAMRALLKSGDVAKIRFFANTARSKDIYILAANFLQTTDWQENPQTIKDIETFYTKSQSYEHLASFYKSCAFVEAENWKSIDKALGALEMATLCIERANEKGKGAASLDNLKTDIVKYNAQLKKLVKILVVLENDNADGIRQLTTLAEQSDEDDIIPCTRIFGMLIEEHVYKKNWKPAYRAVTALQKKMPNIDLEVYIQTETLDKICDEMRIGRITKKKNEEAESDGEEVDFSHSLKRQNIV